MESIDFWSQKVLSQYPNICILQQTPIYMHTYNNKAYTHTFMRGRTHGHTTQGTDIEKEIDIWVVI